MKCETLNIAGLVLDEESRRAIEEIRVRGHLSQLLVAALGSAVVLSIFTAGHPLEASYTLHGTDFEVFARSARGVAQIHRDAVRKIASWQHLRSSEPKQRAFWMAVAQGCKP